MAELLRPMLPVPGPVPEEPGWAYEFSWDGARTLADVAPDGLRLLTSTGRDVAAAFPELAVLAALAPRRLVLDGQVVALDGVGRPSYAQLQRRRGLRRRPPEEAQRRAPVAYYVFDLLRLDGRPTTGLPYQRRRELLEELDVPAGPLVVPPSFRTGEGPAVWDTATRHGLGGVVSKRVDSRYEPGRRSRAWVVTGQRHVQEVIVGGWERGPDGVAAVLVGVPSEAGLRFAGRVSAGFDPAERRALAERLAEVEQRTSPFAGRPPARDARWVSPQLLGEVSYRQWTPQGRLREPAWVRSRPGQHPAAVRGPVVLLPGPVPPPLLIAEQRELVEAVERARVEAHAARTRVSPHFLGNVLGAIAALVGTDPAEARELLAEFADFTRYSLRSAPSTTLGDELDNVERYLGLEQLRFGDRLRVEVTAEPAVLGVELPSLAVQLLVEDAVRDGVERVVGGGAVRVTAVLDDGAAVVTVTDDGPGTEAPDTEGAAATDHRRLVGTRLRAAFGDRASLRVARVPGEGTTAVLRIPVSA